VERSALSFVSLFARGRHWYAARGTRWALPRIYSLFVDCPENVEISGDWPVRADTVLSCSADGKPSPEEFHWTLSGGEVAGSMFAVEAMKNITFTALSCTATNTVTHSNGTNETCSGTDTVSFNCKLFAMCYLKLNSLVNRRSLL